MKRFSLFALAFISLSVSRADQFDDWDKNHDGKLSRDEIPPGPRQHFDEVDTNHDGFISREEHDAFLRHRQNGGQQAPQNIEVIPNIPYAATDNPKQRMDLYLPRNREEGKLPLIVYIHGGAWRAGDKKGGLGTLAPFLRDGHYIGASVEYRFSQDAIWPAQIFDCKAAIRWLRANAEKYKIDTDRIGVWGDSAGGHLVAMLGTSGGVKELEGDLGKFTNESSRVQCVVDFFGPSDFTSMSRITNSINHGAKDSPESKLLGGTPAEKPDAARSASPASFATADDPPFLIAHGSADNTVPFAQSELLNRVLLEAHVATPPVFIKMIGAGHGFSSAELHARIVKDNKKAIQADYLSANARQLQSIYNYQRVVLNAFTEVVNRLSMVENTQRSIEIKQQQLEALVASVDFRYLH